MTRSPTSPIISLFLSPQTLHPTLTKPPSDGNTSSVVTSLFPSPQLLPITIVPINWAGDSQPKNGVPLLSPPSLNSSASLERILLCNYTYQQYEQDCLFPKKTLLCLVEAYYKLSGTLRKLQKNDLQDRLIPSPPRQ